MDISATNDISVSTFRELEVINSNNSASVTHHKSNELYKVTLSATHNQVKAYRFMNNKLSKRSNGNTL